MKSAIRNSILTVSFLALSACPKGGNSDNKTAEVPQQPQIVTANANPNIYCQIGANTLTCFNRLINPTCQTIPANFTDVASMCAQAEMLKLNNTCNVRDALFALTSTRCLGNQSGGFQRPPPPLIGQPSPTFPNQPINPIGSVQELKNIYCSLSGYNGSVQLSGSGIIQVNPNFEKVISLNNPMNCGSTREAGRMTLNYSPGRHGVADKMTLSVDGFNGILNFKQSGFAGQDVRLEASDARGNLNYQLSCSTTDRFSKHIIPGHLKKFVCRGHSNLRDGPGRELINVSFPMDSSLTNSKLFLAEGLTATVTDQGTSEDARIEYNAEGLGRGYSVVSSSYLETTSSLRASSGRYSVDVTCAPQ